MKKLSIAVAVAAAAITFAPMANVQAASACKQNANSSKCLTAQCNTANISALKNKLNQLGVNCNSKNLNRFKANCTGVKSAVSNCNSSVKGTAANCNTKNVKAAKKLTALKCPQVKAVCKTANCK